MEEALDLSFDRLLMMMIYITCLVIKEGNFVKKDYFLCYVLYYKLKFVVLCYLIASYKPQTKRRRAL